MSVPTKQTPWDTAIVREFVASAIYVLLVLLTALLTIPATRVNDNWYSALVLLGTALGLTLAHWFAFRLASGITNEEGHISRHAGQEALAQVGGGMAVAVLVSIPYLLFSGTTAWAVALLMMVCLLAIAGFAIARLRKWSWVWTIVTVLLVLVIAFAIVVVKIALAH